MSTASATALPPWASQVIDLYESGACAQFILHGNVEDRVLLPVSGAAPRIVSLDVFLRERLLGSFDVVISYDLGNGIRVEKGGDRFAEWPPAAKEATAAKAPREAIYVLTHYLRFCANLARLKPEKYMPTDTSAQSVVPQRKRLDGPLYKGFVLAVTKAVMDGLLDQRRTVFRDLLDHERSLGHVPAAVHIQQQFRMRRSVACDGDDG